MLNLVLSLALGLALGGVIGWLLAMRRAVSGPGLEALTDELRRQIAAGTAALEEAKDELAAAQSALATAIAKQQAADISAREGQDAAKAAAARVEQLENELSRERSAHAASAARLGEIEKSLAQQRDEAGHLKRLTSDLNTQLLAAEKARSELSARADSLAEKLQFERGRLQELHETFHKEFEAVSNRLLVANADHFKQQSSESLEKILHPLRENLKDFRTRLEETSSEAGKQNAVLKDQIARISSEAANLARALKGDVKVLGNWGEQRLDQLLEKSGLQQGVHYERQHAAADSETEQQRFLDVIVKLPEGRHLIIDSKVSLTNYEAHINSDDEATRALHLQKHVESIRRHVKELAAKRYQDLYGISSPDFVLMYVPLESAFFAAVAQEPDLFSDALDRNVVLITNSTLLATLRTVAHVWRLADQQKNAIEIATRGGALYDKFAGFVDDMQSLGRSLETSQKSYDEAVKKLHTGRGNLLRQAEELKSLGAKASKKLAAPLLEKALESEEGLSELPAPPNGTGPGESSAVG